MNHPFYFIVMCSQPLLSLAGHRDKLKIKSTRKIIYKSTLQAHAFYPYCSVNVLPPPPSGEKNQCFPSTHSYSSGGRHNTPEPGRGGGSSGEQLKTLVLEPSGHLGTPLCLFQEPLLSWGCGEAACGQHPGREVLSSPITCTSHSPRNKPKKESRQRPRDRGEKSQVFTQLHGVFMAKRTFSSFEY